MSVRRTVSARPRVSARRTDSARRTRAAAIAALVAVPLAVAVASPASAAETGSAYVALGDSYSAGLGAGAYIADSGSCYRSTNAYAPLWAASHGVTSFAFTACSGAKTTDVIANQLAPLGGATRLVTITIGGNDEDFSGTMISCNLWGTTSCVGKVAAQSADARANLPGRLANVYSAIRAKAPNAKVVVLGYPRFYDLSKPCWGLSQESRTALNQGIDLIDSITQTAAAKAGFTFRDVRPAFAGHEICDATPWLHGVDWLTLRQSYHPTAAGQSSAYLPSLSAVASALPVG